MQKWMLLVCAGLLAACGTSHKRHMNEMFARFLEQVHVVCQVDAECTAVLKSCRYPKWGHAAINRMELEDFNRIRQADWYTRCKGPTETSDVKTACRQNRCVLAEDVQKQEKI